MSVPVVCALFLTAIAAYFDWRWQKIPNLLALTGWVIGAGLWMGFRGFRGLSVWALGALIPGLAALAVCRLGAIGAGDRSSARGTDTGRSGTGTDQGLESILGCTAA